MTNNNVNVDEVVETIARMNADERRKFVQTMVIKWTEMSSQISNAIDQEVYHQKHYGQNYDCNTKNNVSRDIPNRAINLPSFHDITEDQLLKVCSILENKVQEIEV